MTAWVLLKGVGGFQPRSESLARGGQNVKVRDLTSLPVKARKRCAMVLKRVENVKET
jgi:hypothetical protein